MVIDADDRDEVKRRFHAGLAQLDCPADVAHHGDRVLHRDQDSRAGQRFGKLSFPRVRRQPEPIFELIGRSGRLRIRC